MTLHYAIVAAFCLMMIANVIALVRHWRMMRVMEVVLTNLAETQQQFNEMIEAERKETPICPTLPS